MDNLLEARNRFYEAWCRCNRLYDELAKMNGLTLNEVLVLFSLFDSKNGCMQKQIADKWVIQKQTVNMILKKYEKLGFLSQKEELDDRRCKSLALTVKGREFAEKVVKQYEIIEIRALEKLGICGVHSMNESIEKYNTFLEEFLSDYNGQSEN